MAKRRRRTTTKAKAPTGELLASALDALAAGQVSAESVLRALLEGKGDFGAWLKRRLARRGDGEARKPRVRRIPPMPAAVTNAILARARAELGRVPGVVGVSWGLKYRGGRAEGERALVAWVDRKIPVGELPEGRALGPTFTAKVGRTRRTVPVDVQSVARGEKQAGATQWRPGNRVGVQVGGELGTLSAYLVPADAGRALISGHVGLKVGNQVTATLPDGGTVAFGSVERLRNDDTVDAAVVKDAPTAQVDAFALEPTVGRELSADDVGVLVRVLLQEGTVQAAIDAVDAPAVFGSDGKMDGLVRLDHRVTNGGDSGSPVVDLAGRLVGFVVGFANVEDDDDHVVRPHTFLLTTRRALDVTTAT